MSSYGATKPQYHYFLKMTRNHCLQNWNGNVAILTKFLAILNFETFSDQNVATRVVMCIVFVGGTMLIWPPYNINLFCHYKGSPMISGKFQHYNDVIMTTTASQITSLTIVYSIVYSDADKKMASYAENVSIWWRHHEVKWNENESCCWVSCISCWCGCSYGDFRNS